MRTAKLQLTVEQLLTGECWIPPKKDTLHPKTKEKTQQDVRRGEIMFRIKPLTQQTLRGLKNIFCTPRPRDPTETDTELCLSASSEATGQQSPAQVQGLWMQHTWVWHNPLGGGHHSIHHRVIKTYTGLGKQTLGGHKQSLVHTRNLEKGAVTPQEIDPDLP